MPWGKLDDQFADHPKIAPLSDAAFRLHVTALLWCNRFLTDGHIPARVAGQLYPDPEQTRPPLPQTLNELLGSGVWEENSSGYAIHDFLDYNRSAVQVKAEREASAKRVQRWRGNAQCNAVTNGVSNGASNGSVTPAPDPNPSPRPNTETEKRGRAPDGAPQPPQAVKKARRKKPGTPWPEGWAFGDSEWTAAERHGCPARESASRAFEEFKAYALAHGKLYVSWPEAWVTWCIAREEEKYGNGWPVVRMRLAVDEQAVKKREAEARKERLARERASREVEERQAVEAAKWRAGPAPSSVVAAGDGPLARMIKAKGGAK